MEVSIRPTSGVFPILDSSHVGEARRAAMSFARDAGLSETECGAVGIVATELGNNLVRHARDGRLAIQWLATPRGNALEILSIDAGPGMVAPERCLQDGYSTSGTPGTGLGAVKRMSTEFDLYSEPGRGTVIVSRVLPTKSAQTAPPALVWGAYCRPVAGETECGDAWDARPTGQLGRFLVVDGLGHGPQAAVAARRAIETFERRSQETPQEFLAAAHGALAGTRGAAAAMLSVDLHTRAIRFAGVGNIAATLCADSGNRGLISHNGILGVQVRKFQAFDYTWPADSLLVMHSDGLRTRWSLADYPGVQLRHPSVVAGVLARDFDRGSDDLTVVVARLGGGR